MPTIIVVVPQTEAAAIQAIKSVDKIPSLRLVLALPSRFHRLAKDPLIAPIFYRLVDAGRLELAIQISNPPLLPLLIDTDEAKRTLPPGTDLPIPAYRHPEDVTQIVARTRADFFKSFSRAPKGIVLPYGAVSTSLLELLQRLNMAWVVAQYGLAEKAGVYKRKGLILIDGRINDMVFDERVQPEAMKRFGELTRRLQSSVPSAQKPEDSHKSNNNSELLTLNSGLSLPSDPQISVQESHTIKDETLYIRRMLGQHVDLSEVAQEASENVKLAAHTLAEEVQDVTKAYNPDETKSPFGVMHQEVASVEKAVTTLSQSQFDALTLQNIGSGMVIDTRYDSGVTISRRNVSHADEALGKHILTALTAMGYGQSQAIKLIEGGVIKIEFVDGLPENRDGRFVPETNTIQINSAIKDNASRLLPTLMEELDHLLTGETDRTVTPRNILNWVKKVGGEAALQVLRDMQIPESDPLFKAVLYAATQIEEEGAKPMRNVEKGGHIWNQDLLDAILDIFMKAPAMAGFNPDAMNSPVKSDQNPGPIGGSSLFDRLRGKYNLPADAGAMAIIMAA